VTRRREHFRITRCKSRYDRREGRFIVDIAYEAAVEVTPRTIGVAEAFGLGIDDTRRFIIYDNVELRIGPRDIVYITGDSGSGKSALLRAIKRDLEEAGESVIDMEDIRIEEEKPIVETVGSTLDEALKLLSRVGLNDAHLFLRKYRELSDGQRYRYRIAKLMESGRQWWIMDEFCSTLDRETAKIVAYNLQKQARRMGRAVIAATTHTDLMEDLAPSVHIHKGWGRRVEVKYYPNKLRKRCTVTKGLRIEEGDIKDYKRLAEFHYRNPETYPPPLKIYKLRKDGATIGVIVYSYPPPNCQGRVEALGRRPTLKELNRNFATISRVVIHPKYRSIGLGVKLVKETLPRVGRPYVEAIAVMARYNPFFEKAGMEKVTETEGDETIKEAIRRLRKLGFKPHTLPSINMNMKTLKEMKPEDIDEVKRIILTISQGYYKRLKASGKGAYTKRKEFKEFIEKAEKEEIAKVLSRIAILAQRKAYLIWRRSEKSPNKPR